MKRKRFTQEQIIRVLQEAESGLRVADLCRKYGFSDGTFYNWKSKYGGLSISDARRLKTLEQENGRLKRIIADLTLDNQVLQELNSKNF